MHVRCLLVCCTNSNLRSNSNSPNQTGACLPTQHIFRVDTEMCGLCHLFVYELSSTSPTQKGSRIKQQSLIFDGSDNLTKGKSESALPAPSSSQNDIQVMAEDLWHLRPNTSKSMSNQFSSNNSSCMFVLIFSC